MRKFTVAVIGSLIATGLLALAGPSVASADSVRITGDPASVNVTEDKIW
jgi:hypothetical protein